MLLCISRAREIQRRGYCMLSNWEHSSTKSFRISSFSGTYTINLIKLSFSQWLTMQLYIAEKRMITAWNRRWCQKRYSNEGKRWCAYNVYRQRWSGPKWNQWARAFSTWLLNHMSVMIPVSIIACEWKYRLDIIDERPRRVANDRFGKVCCYGAWIRNRQVKPKLHRGSFRNILVWNANVENIRIAQPIPRNFEDYWRRRYAWAHNHTIIQSSRPPLRIPTTDPSRLQLLPPIKNTA